jgi:RimJ/RimL family protein N-acetyltransferase
MLLQGRYCNLRSISIKDAEITLTWRLSDKAKYLHKGSKTIEEQTIWIENALEKKDEFNFIIEYKSIPVGMISIVKINYQHRTCEIGRLLIGETEFVGHAPVAYESELLLSDYVFDCLKLHKMYGFVLEDNKEMLNYRKYFGYKKEGLLRDHYIFDGEFKNTVVVSILENEYRTLGRPKLLMIIEVSTT